MQFDCNEKSHCSDLSPLSDRVRLASGKGWSHIYLMPPPSLENLTGKLLIAMPGMSDPRFEKSVVFLCEHSEKGAMGLIVNKPARDVSAGELLEQLGLELGGEAEALQIHFGGPVEHGRGFVLHSRDYASGAGTLDVTEDVGMTATLDILEDIAGGRGPKRAILALGYAGWGPGQLESEFQDNGWLVSDAPAEVVFLSDDTEKWAAALRQLGVDAVALSAAGGHA